MRKKKETKTEKSLTLHEMEELYIKDCFGEEAWQSIQFQKLNISKKNNRLLNKKIINIHTRKEVTNTDKDKKHIDPTLVKKYVFENINFHLTEEYWTLIDNTFSEIWNDKIGIGGYFDWDDISGQIYSNLKNQKILIEFEKIIQIVNLILTYIENTGGFME